MMPSTTLLEVPEWVQRAIVDATEVHVIAPLMGSRLSAATDDQAMYDHAHQRLASVLEHTRSTGATPSGAVVDAGPLAAIQTFLLDHDIDILVVGVTADGHWREKGMLDKLREHTTAHDSTRQQSCPR